MSSWNFRIKKRKKQKKGSTFPDLLKDMIPQIQHTLSKIGTKIPTTGNIMVNLGNILNQGHEKLSSEMIKGETG